MTIPSTAADVASRVSSLHPLDQALQMQSLPDGRVQASTHAGYWNMVGPYGGITAAQMLQAVMQHPQRQGDPITLTVNFAGPLQAGDFLMEVLPMRTNRSNQHWCITLRQRNAQGLEEVCCAATAITGARRETFSIDDVPPPAMPDPMTCERFDPSNMLQWLQRYDMRVVKGAIPAQWDESIHDSVTQLWVRDDPPRPLDFVALTALCDVFYPRVWLRRARQVPAGTVGMTVYFHADRAQLLQQADQHVLAQAGAQGFRNGYFDQTAQLWSSDGVLLASSHQIVYFKE